MAHKAKKKTSKRTAASKPSPTTVKPRSIGLAERDWNWIKKKSAANGISVSAFVQALIKEERQIEKELGL